MENLFNASNEFYGTCYKAIEEAGKTKKKKLTSIKQGPPPFDQHLNKQTKIGLFPFVNKKEVGFAAIDIDDYSVDHHQIIKKLSNLKVKATVGRSTNNGCHVYFFFKTPVAASDARDKLDAIADRLGYNGCEVFPKQNIFDPQWNPKARKGRGGWKGLGNFIYIPGGMIPGLDDASCFFTEDGKEIDPAEVESYADQMKVDFEELPTFNREIKTTHVENENARRLELGKDPVLSVAPDISQFPPCLAKLYIDGVGEGGRNNYIFNSAIMVKKAKGVATVADLEPYIKRIDMAGFDDDIDQIVEYANDSKYSYRCKEVPIKALCEKDKCRTKALGIGKSTHVDTERYRFTYIRQVNGFADNVNGELYAPTHMNNLLKSYHIYDDEDKRLTDVSKYLLVNETEKLERYGFNPSKPNRYKDEGVLHFNGYRPPAIIQSDGDIEPWNKLIRNVMPKEEYVIPFEQYIAHNIQRPGVKIKWCPFVIGRQGLGKDLIVEGLRPSLGKDYIADIDMQLLKQDHTGHFDRKVFAVLSETRQVGKDKSNVGETLKKLITDRRLKMRKMNMDAFWMDNVMNMMFFSNFKTALTLDEDARRFMVIINENPRKDKEFYAPIWDLVDNNPGRIYKHYMEYDLTGFNIASAPQTEYLKEVSKLTDMPADQYLDFLYEEKVWPFHHTNPYISILHIHECLVTFKKKYNIDPTLIKMWLQKKQLRGEAEQCCRIDWYDSKTMIWTLSPDTHHEKSPSALRDIYLMPTEPVKFLSWDKHNNPPF
tara:strand:- start:698 stop:2998 length:2301 start_codon:yes stop_codon:yes gene_type:complete